MSIKQPTVELKEAERPFNPSRSPSSDLAWRLVAEVQKQLLEFESIHRLRARARKSADQEVFEQTVRALVSDVIVRELHTPGGWICVSLSNKSLSGPRDQRPAAFNKQLPRIVERLSHPGLQYLEFRKGCYGPFGGHQSTVRAGRRLRELLKALDIFPSDFGSSGPRGWDAVVLRASKVRGQKGKKLALPDTEEVRTLRRQMMTINEALAAADLKLGRAATLQDGVDVSDRFMRRIFNNGSLRQGGRLFGGFWQRMKKANREGEIWFGNRIDGGYSSGKELDFGQAGIRIAYSLVESQPPSGDLYEIPGFGLEHRDGIKRVLNALMAASQELSRFPQDTKQYFPRHQFSAVVEALRNHHRPISRLFGRGAVYELQYVESQVLVDALLTMVDQGIVALPLHDCVMVSYLHADDASEILREAFRRVTGLPGVIA